MFSLSHLKYVRCFRLLPQPVTSSYRCYGIKEQLRISRTAKAKLVAGASASIKVPAAAAPAAAAPAAPAAPSPTPPSAITSAGAQADAAAPFAKIYTSVMLERGKSRLFQGGNPLVYGGAIASVEGSPQVRGLLNEEKKYHA
jgi:hypothetical protein